MDESRKGLLNPLLSVNPYMQVSKSYGLAVVVTATTGKKNTVGILSDDSLLCLTTMSLDAIDIFPKTPIGFKKVKVFVCLHKSSASQKLKQGSLLHPTIPLSHQMRIQKILHRVRQDTIVSRFSFPYDLFTRLGSLCSFRQRVIH